MADDLALVDEVLMHGFDIVASFCLQGDIEIVLDLWLIWYEATNVSHLSLTVLYVLRLLLLFPLVKRHREIHCIEYTCFFNRFDPFPRVPTLVVDVLLVLAQSR